MRLVGIASALTLALAVVGCAVDPATTPGSDQADPNEEYITRTIVRLRADGTEEVTAHRVAASVARAQAEAHAARVQAPAAQPQAPNAAGAEATGQAAQAIAARYEDNGSDCQGTDLWLYDAAAYGGNQICFYGGGTVELRNYCRQRTCFFNPIFGWQCSCAPGAATWSGAVRSYASGTNSGHLGSRSGDFFSPCASSWPGGYNYVAVSPASACEQAATMLRLYP